MDAPPAQEDCRPYVHVAQVLTRHGVHAPAILASDLHQGFLLLSDLGDSTYFDALGRAGVDVDRLYRDALETLVQLQHCPLDEPLPPYDRDRLLTEMRLFPDWYVQRHLGVTLEPSERAELDAAFERLVENAGGQAQVLVHRDFHSRNLMFLDANAVNPGVVDFQDAVIGPITYDVVSLLRDAYVEWPEDRQIDWAARYWERARTAGHAVPASFDTFWRDMEWMGLQRSLKILGIFCRLFYRDGKDRYLGDLPVVLRHTRRVAERYDAFAGLARLLDRIHGNKRTEGYTF
jgi:aminoglycoside/choline kinase family phosphotransferase